MHTLHPTHPFDVKHHQLFCSYRHAVHCEPIVSSVVKLQDFMSNCELGRKQPCIRYHIEKPITHWKCKEWNANTKHRKEWKQRASERKHIFAQQICGVVAVAIFMRLQNLSPVSAVSYIALQWIDLGVDVFKHFHYVTKRYSSCAISTKNLTPTFGNFETEMVMKWTKVKIDQSLEIWNNNMFPFLLWPIWRTPYSRKKWPHQIQSTVCSKLIDSVKYKSKLIEESQNTNWF